MVRTSTAECYNFASLVAVYEQSWMLEAFQNWTWENAATSALLIANEEFPHNNSVVDYPMSKNKFDRTGIRKAYAVKILMNFW